MLTVLFTLFFILLFMNLPVAFSIGLSSMAALCFYGDLPLSAIVTRMYSGVDSFTLLAIPFFIAAGEIMNESGITDKIVSFSKALVGHIKGGLAHVSIVSSMFFSGISGSATADASALGSMLIPAMKKSGIDTDFAVAVSASSSAIGPIIPPSILFVIYGSIANVSIAKLFLGGIIPGILIGFALMIVTYLYAKKRGYPSEKRSSLKELIKSQHITGISHITGGGVLGNIPRMLPKHLNATIHKDKINPNSIFEWLQKIGNITDTEMLKTFNCGLGIVLSVQKNNYKNFINTILDKNLPIFEIGHIDDVKINDIIRCIYNMYYVFNYITSKNYIFPCPIHIRSI